MLKAQCFAFLYLMFSLCTAQENYPKLTEIVTDNAKIFTEAQLEGLRAKLYQFESETTNQVVVLTINELGNETIEHYALEVFNQNKLGQEDKDNGILFLFSKLDREVRIEVGYGLESYITDAVASRIIRNTMIPRFKEEDYFEGIDLATEQIIEFLEDPEALAEFNKVIEAEGKISWWLKVIIGLFLIIFMTAGVFAFYKGYTAVIEILHGIFIGKLAVFRGVFMAASMLFLLLFGIVFMAVPIVFILLFLGFEDLLNRLINDLTWMLYVFPAFVVITLLLVIIKIKRNGKEDFKLSFFKSDKSYISKTFSASGTHSFGSSSGGSSSSSFSGGGGSSGGGGASGSW
ncbi:TPM domain-containing protein [Allomuricauda sp. F6463D]|uniref:TPM domain-containing protein n=1 Tax=Allomuricauda sp. F6463D TaxID=2926409 RepID=UPI001FF1F7E2|nr:TPM domain-containing protein [Muricauda sp. F6463D]MCK0161516.1 TPM domain-containing protein [Muricauda sp. F6463D]